MLRQFFGTFALSIGMVLAATSLFALTSVASGNDPGPLYACSAACGNCDANVAFTGLCGGSSPNITGCSMAPPHCSDCTGDCYGGIPFNDPEVTNYCWCLIGV